MGEAGSAVVPNEGEIQATTVEFELRAEDGRREALVQAETCRYDRQTRVARSDSKIRIEKGDIVVTGKNFGAGSSRQQAVDCFESLGVTMVIAESFGAIYERNAINKGFPIVVADLIAEDLDNGQEIEVDLRAGVVRLPSGKETEAGFSDVQMDIYKRGGLLRA